jgi:hypothetical protein
MKFLLSELLISRSKIKRIYCCFTKNNNIINNKKDYSDNFISQNDKIIDLRKEKIKKLKIKEPVKVSSWHDCGDNLDEIKEKIIKLKLKEPVKISSWDDEF